MTSVPALELPPAPRDWAEERSLLDLDWEAVPPLSPLLDVRTGGPARQPTTVRACDSGSAVWVSFECSDERIVAPRTRRDSSVYEDEVVEVFLAPGEQDPVRYLEFEVSPGGVLLDARIDNPAGALEHITVDREWDCPGVRWAAQREDHRGRWRAALVLPWRGLDPEREDRSRWRANFCRIDRAQDPARDEFTCWSPTASASPDFHRPTAFGHLRRVRG